MTPARAFAYRNILAVVQVVAAIAVVVGSRDGLDFEGRPIGLDFISFWTASKIVLTDLPVHVYDMATHLAVQRAAFGGAPLNYTAFFYPPVFLLICLPLALLPYGWALAAWLLTTGGAFLAALGKQGRAHILSVLAFPAIWLNIAHGQNGFLTAALFAAGIRYLDAWPVLAGLFLGGLIYKPHFLTMLPVVLLVEWRWHTAVAAACSAALLVALSVAVLGVAPWYGFAASAATARAVLEQGAVGDYKMHSVFAAIRLFGGGLAFAYSVQGIIALGAAGLLGWLCRKSPGAEAIGAALAAAAVLASPFLLVYDFVLLTIPLLWIWREARTTGFLAWEKSVAMAAFFMPLVASVAAFRLHIPVAPLTTIALFVAVVRRISSSPIECR